MNSLFPWEWSKELLGSLIPTCTVLALLPIQRLSPDILKEIPSSNSSNQGHLKETCIGNLNHVLSRGPYVSLAGMTVMRYFLGSEDVLSLMYNVQFKYITKQ